MKEKKYLIIGITIVLLTLIGVSYAYFSTIITGNKKKVTMTSAGLKIIFTNGDAIEASEVYAEDNLDIIKTFSVENKTKNEYKYNIVIEDLVNTFKTTGYLVYKITSDDGGYNMTEFRDVPKRKATTDTGLAYNVLIPANTKHNYNIEIKYLYSETENQSLDMGKILSGKIFISDGTLPTLSYKILEDNPTISERTDFSTTFTENTTGTLFVTDQTQDESSVYYYSGNTTNNWVKYIDTSCTYNGIRVYYFNVNNYGVWDNPFILPDGTVYKINSLTKEECLSTNVCSTGSTPLVGLTEEQCEFSRGTWTTDKATYNESSSLYWRIIRTNEDGSTRLLFAGTSPNTTKGYVDLSVFNENNNDPMYVGYMYGTSGSLSNNRYHTNDSKINGLMNYWFNKNLDDKTYLLDKSYDKTRTELYCNDRSVANNSYSLNNPFNYGVYTRLKNSTPTYLCGGNGNGGLFEDKEYYGDLFYEIGLMTADEIVFAGGNINSGLTNPYAWYYTNSEGNSITNNSSWWTMSPSKWDGTQANVWIVDGNGKLDENGNVSTSYAIRPVISLDASALVKSGNGTPETPYEIQDYKYYAVSNYQ